VFSAYKLRLNALVIEHFVTLCTQKNFEKIGVDWKIENFDNFELASWIFYQLSAAFAN